MPSTARTKSTRILTIGVYRWTEKAFFDALVDVGVTTFVDIRRRRGLRGPLYAFANSGRLQARLEELGIRYEHVLELAPDAAMLEAQHAIDRKGAGVRQRVALSPAYVKRFRARILARFDPRAFLERLGDHGAICLFCVEDRPETCHRSLVAEAIRDALGLRVEHLLPGA